MRFIKNGFLLFSALAVLVTATSAGAQSSGGVEVNPIANGGFKYRFHKEGLDILRPYGSMQSDGYAVPFDAGVRSGCFAATKWIPVRHIRGNLTFFPHLRTDWRGELGGPDHGLTADLFNFRIELTKADGTTRSFRRYVDTNSMDLQWRATYPDGTQAYVGTLVNPNPHGTDDTFGNTIPVDTGDQARLLVCDVWSGVSLTIHNIDAYSIPVITD